MIFGLLNKVVSCVSDHVKNALKAKSRNAPLQVTGFKIFIFDRNVDIIFHISVKLSMRAIKEPITC